MKWMIATGKCTSGKMSVRTEKGDTYYYEIRKSVLVRENKIGVVAKMVDCTQRYILPVERQSS